MLPLLGKNVKISARAQVRIPVCDVKGIVYTRRVKRERAREKEFIMQ